MLPGQSRKRALALLTAGLLFCAAGFVVHSTQGGEDAARPQAPQPPVAPVEKAPPAEKNKLIVHEWGTFLTVQGSNGATLGGMVASEEVLPPFVESPPSAPGTGPTPSPRWRRRSPTSIPIGPRR